MLLEINKIGSAIEIVLDELYNKQEVEEYHSLEMQRAEFISFDYNISKNGIWYEYVNFKNIKYKKEFEWNS